MAGYSGTPLIKKLGIKPGFRVALVGAPKDFKKELGPLPEMAKFSPPTTDSLDVILLFASSARNLILKFAPLAAQLKKNGMIWVAWPKKSSGVITDLTENDVQRIGLDAGLVDIKVCAVTDIWSGLKFVYRLKDRAGKEVRISTGRCGNLCGKFDHKCHKIVRTELQTILHTRAAQLQ